MHPPLPSKARTPKVEDLADIEGNIARLKA